MQTWEYIWEIVINFIETTLLIIFLEDKLSHSKNISEKSGIFIKMLFIFTDGLCTSLMNYLNTSYAINYLATFIIFSIFSMILYDGKISKKIFFTGIYLAILFTADTIAATLPPAVFDTEITSILTGGSLRVVGTLLYISCIVCLVFISHFFKWNIISMSPMETIVFIFIATIGLFFGQFTSSLSIFSLGLFHDATFTNKLIIISIIYCILYLVLMTYIYALNITREQNKKLLENNHRLMLEEVNYKNLIESTASLRRLKHDMQHHLSAIRYLANQNKLIELDNYIAKYTDMLEGMHKFVSTGNSAIDCILSTNIPKAEEKGIRVKSILTVPDSFILDPILTSSLLGNLWTNAIAACEKIISVDLGIVAFIDFYIKPVENMLLISIENSFDGKTKKDTNGNYISIKTNTQGIGLRRIAEIVEQNDGIMEVTDKNNIFAVHIMFPLKEINFNENCNS